MEVVQQDLIMASHESSDGYEKPNETSSKKKWKNKGKMCSAIYSNNYQETCELLFSGS